MPTPFRTSTSAISLMLVGILGCDGGEYEVWIESDREFLAVAAWDSTQTECATWYPRQLAGTVTDTDTGTASCLSCVDEIVFHWNDGRPATSREPEAGLAFESWKDMEIGAVAGVEIRGCAGDKTVNVMVPGPLPVVAGTTAVGPSTVSVTWAAPDTADLACLGAGLVFSGAWTCGEDSGEASLAVPDFDPQLHSLGATRLWRERNEPGLSVWQRQALALDIE